MPSRATSLKSAKYDGNIAKRGKVSSSGKRDKDEIKVGPYVLGFLLFVVVGSAVFQIMEATQKSNSFG